MLSTRCPICQALIPGDSLKQIKRALALCRHGSSSLILPQLPCHWTFDRAVLSQNITTYGHRWVYHSDKVSWVKYLVPAMTNVAGLDLTKSFWCLARHYAKPKREYDWANFVGGCKPIIDVLTNMRIIRDDAPLYFNCEYVQVLDTKNFTKLSLLKAEQC